MTKHFAIILAFLTMLSLPVVAQSHTKGLDAYNAGNNATALSEWKPLAEAINAKAQIALGVIYSKG